MQVHNILLNYILALAIHHIIREALGEVYIRRMK